MKCLTLSRVIRRAGVRKWNIIVLQTVSIITAYAAVCFHANYEEE